MKIPENVMEGFHMNTIPPQEVDYDKELEKLERKNFIRMVAGGLIAQNFKSITTNPDLNQLSNCWNIAILAWQTKPKDC